ncbi:MAG TPA: sigma-70 family RNA polymerase sigma factor [Ktedonobacterales bacterium]|jgi:RNA polymerase sigma-70 factor (ECF subfamily)
MMLQGEPVQQNTPASAEASTAPAGLRALYEETLPTVYRYVYSKVGNREEAEDLTSQVYLKALRGLDTARDGSAAQAWLFQVARTTIADYWRGFYRIRTSSLDDLLAAGWDSPINVGQPPGDQSAVARAQRILSGLPDRYREVLTCRFLLNLSLKETASRMSLTEANVKVLQFRALKKASALGEQHTDGDESQ